MGDMCLEYHVFFKQIMESQNQISKHLKSNPTNLLNLFGGSAALFGNSNREVLHRIGKITPTLLLNRASDSVFTIINQLFHTHFPAYTETLVCKPVGTYTELSAFVV